jgi:hypothetical protein
VVRLQVLGDGEGELVEWKRGGWDERGRLRLRLECVSE